LAASLQGAHLEVITFDSVASVILPLTTDTTAYATAVQGLLPQISSYSQGSTIDKAYNLIQQ
jgi:Ca-activated chloride channel family protein